MPRSTEANCSRCLHKVDCKLKSLLDKTLPWVKVALEKSGSEDDRQIAVCRALRGTWTSPGFTEDWINESALKVEDFKEMVGDIVRSNGADSALLSRYCRRFVELRKY